MHWMNIVVVDVVVDIIFDVVVDIVVVDVLVFIVVVALEMRRIVFSSLLPILFIKKAISVKTHSSMS